MHLLTCATLAMLLWPGIALATEAALHLPLVHRSLLLDITTAGNTFVAVGERGHVLVGDGPPPTWRQARVPTRQMLTAVHFVDDKRGWAVGHDGLILASSNGGLSWALQYDGLARQVGFNRDRLEQLQGRRRELQQQLTTAVDRTVRESLISALDELLLDIEEAEHVLASPVETPPLLDVWFADASHGYAAGAFGKLLVTGDGGRTWHRVDQRLGNPMQLHLNGLTGDGRGMLWIAGETGLLFRSGDGGQTWESLDSPYDGSFFGISRAPETGRLLVHGLRGHAFYSDDQGDSWRRCRLDSDRSIAGGTWLNADYAVMVGGVGSVLVSDDGGRSFSARSLEHRLALSAVASLRGRLAVVGWGGVQVLGSVGGD